MYLLLPALCALCRGGGSLFFQFRAGAAVYLRKGALATRSPEAASAVGGDELPEREVRTRSPGLAPPEWWRLSGCSCAADPRVHEDQFLFITYSKGNRGLSTFVGVS